MSDLLSRAVTAAITELHRQAQTTGNRTDTDGRWAQVDGSFDLETVVKAVLVVAQAEGGPGSALIVPPLQQSPD
jgi:hypothetical protein